MLKEYLVIKYVGQNTSLRRYLEQICDEECVQVVEEYVDSFSFLKQTESIYSKFNANPTYDVLISSYDINKLHYIKYLYDKFVNIKQSVDEVFLKKQVTTTNPSISSINLTVDISGNVLNQVTTHQHKSQLEEWYDTNYTPRIEVNENKPKDSISKLTIVTWVLWAWSAMNILCIISILTYRHFML
jgi:hypothetical protein